MEEKKQGKLIIISGFSGSGKGTLVERLRQKHENYSLSVSMTTRAPRNNEVDGVHYIFTDDAKFEQMIAEDGFLEYAGYVERYYGSPKKFVMDERAAGKDVILEIEMQGALKVKEKYPEAYLVFVFPPSFEILRERLIGRGTETMEVVEKRMQRAKEELAYIPSYDLLMVNDDLETSVSYLHEKIQAYSPKEES